MNSWLRFSEWFKDTLEVQKRQNILLRCKNKRKLKEVHKDFMEHLISNNSKEVLTISSIKQKLTFHFVDFPSVHNTTISRWLRSDLKWSYKKLEKKPIPTQRPESRRIFLEGALIQALIKEKNVELIFIDEFSVNSRHHAFRGWTRKGRKGYMGIDTHNFQMSFVWGVSNKRLNGLMGVLGKWNSAVFKHYLKQIFSELELSERLTDNERIIVWDNASIHLSDMASGFISSSKLRVITIPPYNPVLNPAEKLINCIKMKLRKAHGMGK